MKNNLRLFLTSLTLVASFGTQLSAITPEISPTTENAITDTNSRSKSEKKLVTKN